MGTNRLVFRFSSTRDRIDRLNSHNVMMTKFDRGRSTSVDPQKHWYDELKSKGTQKPSKYTEDRILPQIGTASA